MGQRQAGDSGLCILTLAVTWSSQLFGGFVGQGKALVLPGSSVLGFYYGEMEAKETAENSNQPNAVQSCTAPFSFAAGSLSVIVLKNLKQKKKIRCWISKVLILQVL